MLAVKLPTELACALPVTAILALVLFAPAALALTESQRITANDAAVNDIFGVAVSISGGAAIVGAAGDDDTANSAGTRMFFATRVAASSRSKTSFTPWTARRATSLVRQSLSAATRPSSVRFEIRDLVRLHISGWDDGSVVADR